MSNFASYLASTRSRESGGDDNAKNPNSSASGRYQFIDSTYLSYARRLFPGLSDEQLMGMKNDPSVQDRIMSEFTSDNGNSLRAAGFEANDRNLYLSHFLGSGGALRALRADPSTPVSMAVDPAAINSNPFLRDWTVGDLLKWAETKKRPDGNALALVNQTGPQSAAQAPATFGASLTGANPLGLSEKQKNDILGFGIGGFL